MAESEQLTLMREERAARQRLEDLAAQIGFEAGKVIARDGKPLPEKKKKKE